MRTLALSALAALFVVAVAAKGWTEDAAEECKKIQDLNSQKLDIRGKTAEQAGEAALAHFNEIIAKCEAFIKQYAGTPQVNDVIYEEGRAYLNRSRWVKDVAGDQKKAMELAMQVVKADPKSEAAAKSHGLLIQYYKMTNKADQLVAEAQALVKDCHDSPEAPLALHYIADVYETSGNMDEAYKIYALMAKEYGETVQGQIAAGIIRLRDIVGQPLDMTFKSASGEDVDTKTMKGKVVLVIFWAPDHPASKSTLTLAANALKANGQSLAVVGVFLGTDEAQLKSETAAVGATWPEFLDPKNKKSKNEQAVKFGVRGYPFTILADRSGKVRETGLLGAKLSDAITKLAAEPAK